MSGDLGLLEDETDYYLGPVLGRGVSGYVYEGFRRADGLDVVIKVLTKKLTRHEEVLNHIKEDVACAAFANIRHKHVARTLGMVQIDGRDAIVIQMAPGRPLSDILEEHGAITDRRALKLAIQIVEGLLAAFRKGLHHGDLRPNKLFVDTRGRLWITDFGLAYGSCVAGRFKKYADIPFGHPEYLAPEVIQDGLTIPNQQTDLYALGVTLYELVCGTVPFRGLSQKDTLRQHLEEKMPPPPPGVEVSSAMADLILALTSKNPESRMKNLVECLRMTKGTLTGKDPMDVSMSNDDWMEASGRYAIGAAGWNASKIGEDNGSREASQEEAPEVLFPPGEFMSGTGFFKPHLSNIAVLDPFDAARRGSFSKRVVGGFKKRASEVNISGKDILFTLSVLLNVVLLWVLFSYGLAPKRDKVEVDPWDVPVKSDKGRSKTAKDDSKSPKKPIKAPILGNEPLNDDERLRDKITASLKADDTLKQYDPKVVLVFRSKIWFNLSRLPTVTGDVDSEKMKSVAGKRKSLVVRARQLITKQVPKNRGIYFPALSDNSVAQTFTHRHALFIAMRALYFEQRGDRQAAARAAIDLQRLANQVRESEDAYRLAVGYAAMDRAEDALTWLSTAFEQGFKDSEALSKEPFLAGLRNNGRFWQLLEEFQITGVRKSN
ncbi:MAG: serine/threonine-protein kinase [Planctomycetota bacterium]|nr:serine/threonine-protein kinase [Planctomycetota bacterium]